MPDSVMTDHTRQMQAYWTKLDTRFPQAEAVFDACMTEALALLTPTEIDAYLEAARGIGKLGRGVEPLLEFMTEWPSTVQAVGATALPTVMATIQAMQKSPNSSAMTPFLSTMAPVAHRLQSPELFQQYLNITLDLMARTTGSIHGHHTTFPSPGLPDFLAQAPRLLNLLSLGGLKKWVDYGIRNYHSHPERQKDFFSLQSADSRAVLQRERSGTLLVDVTRSLDLYLRGLWQDEEQLIPYSTAFDELRKPIPYYDKLGIRLPDVQEDLGDIQAIDRYRAVLAHITGHRRWSHPQIADNWSPFQRMAVEFFEDCRIDTLLIREYPGLRRLFLALHPHPAEEACDPETTSCLRHRLVMLSRALLDPQHGYHDEDLNAYVPRFHAALEHGASSTGEIATLALSYVAKTRRQSDQFAKIHFDNTVVDYRDDNRQLWQFIESGDEEAAFDEPRKIEPQEITGLPPRHYSEWDYHSQSYRPDWVSLYEAIHPSGNAADIDRLLQKHAGLAKQLKKMLDWLKPQDKVRIRYQEEGSELDLDIAIRSLIDFKGGSTPDPRINMSHRTNGRSIAVMLLLDLSESLNEKVAGSEQTILELSQEAVSLLAWSIEQLGDPFAIAGFNSNTRFEVRYQHIKGYSEGWNDDVKARLAAMRAGYSTRMGAALRHAAHYLEAQKADKKLMLILTDGQPADIDTTDDRLLIEDARQAVKELDQKGIFPYCISLDASLKAGEDDYVRDIFGQHYTVIDHIERLPERLPQLFMSLTR
ncbi:MAG: VWA domain-containing protein [Halothiobacillus sp.]